MSIRSLQRLVILFIVGMLAGPSLPAMHSDAGSAIIHTPGHFANGSGNGTVVVEDGVKLGVEKEYLNNWTMLDDGQPGGIIHGSLVYDEARDEYIIFGFDWTWGGYMETYTYNKTTDDWENLYSLLKYNAPLAQESWTLRYSVVYDSVHSEAIVFGGLNGETCIFNRTEASWTNKKPALSPTPRYSFNIAFDTVYGEAVLFGGQKPTEAPTPYEPAPHFNDTWTYNPVTNTWTNMTPTVSPPGLCNHTMAYDRANGVTILFGGRTEEAVNETWAYNRSTNSWTNMSPANSPSPRQWHSMVYDSGKGRMVMFGGATPDYNNETWTYDFSANTWTNITEKFSPLPRIDHTMAYDSKNSQILLYGGLIDPNLGTGESQTADVWIYDVATDNWSVRSAKTPMPNWEYDMAFDATSGEVILKSEYLFSGGPETWSFNLSTNKWENLKPFGPTPNLIGNGMVYDRARGTMVVHGFENYGYPRTWMYNLSNNTWSPMNSPDPVPTRGDGAMAYDMRADRTVLFGGYSYLYSMDASNETWSYDLKNNTWTNMTPLSSPPERIFCMMTYIDSTSEILLFGGALDWRFGGMYNDTWKYNYTTNKWTNLTKPNGPPLYSRYTSANSMIYDDKWNEVILILGESTWIFNVSTNDWAKVTTATTHRSAAGSTLVYDSSNDEIVLFGGQGYDFYQGETWAFNHRVLFKEGNHTSVPIDTGGISHFGTLNWSADVPEGTGLRLQLRSADIEAGLSSMPFIGPDGTNQTYYNTSGQAISDDHSNTRWIQYRVYLNTTYDLLSPVLKSVEITYNRLPEIPILNSPSHGEWTNSSRPIFSWAAQDNDSSISGFELQMDDSPLFDSVDHSSGQVVSTDSTYQPTAPITDGTWYWRIRTLDSDGDWGPFSGSRVLRVDTGPPEPFQPVVDPPGWTNGTIQLTFNTTDSAVGMSHYEVQIDGVSQGMQESPFTLPLLSDGEHSITINAYDLLWNCRSSEVKVYQDRTPPLAFTPIAEPPGWTNRSPLIFFNTLDETSGMARYEVRVDGGSFSIKTSPYALPDLTEGQHNVTVRAYDAAETYRDALISIYLDKTKPFNFTVASDCPGWTNKNPNITFQAIDNLSKIDHYEVKLLGDNFTVQTSPYLLPNLPDGGHNITIRAVDKALNYIEATIEVLIDKTAPADFTPSANPASWTNNNPKINFTTMDNTSGISHYEVGIDGGSLNASTSPFTVPNLTDGEHQVLVRAYDKAGNSVDGTVHVFVDKTPPVQLSLNVNEGEKSTDKRRVLLSISASDATSGLESMSFSNDGVYFRDWMPYNSTASWTLTQESGKKTIYVKVKDKAGNEATSVSASITYSPAQAESQLNMALLLLALLIIIGAAIGAWRWRVSKKTEKGIPSLKEEETLPKPTEEEVPPIKHGAEPEPPMATVLAEAPAVPAGAAKSASVQIEAAKETAIHAKIKKTPAPRPPPILAPPVPTVTASESFAVEDVFLIYRDGRLIQHTTRRLKADMDFDVVTSMLTAVQEFIKESFGKAEGQELGSMEFGDSKILLQKGRNIVLAAVISGPEATGFRDELKAAVKNIEGEFAAVLPEWDGGVSKLAGAKRFLAQLGAYQPTVAPPVKGKDEVSIKAELEFYQGFVRLKVAVKNTMPTTITDSYFRLIYNQEVLRLDQAEPESGRRGDEVQIGNVQPNEKRTIAFYLDPQICTESYLEGVLTFKDAHGNLDTVKMPRKLASVVCPILFTDENINTAMLKRMAVDELPQKDTKVFAIPPTTSPDKSFEIAKAAVQHHDVRLVREFGEKEPYVGEAWYYGKAKGREDKIVIRARVISAKNVLEFFVASTSTLMLTGMLAELKTDLNKELDSRNVRTGMRQITSQKDVDALGAIKTLLEKASGSEIDAGETEAN